MVQIWVIVCCVSCERVSVVRGCRRQRRAPEGQCVRDRREGAATRSARGRERMIADCERSLKRARDSGATREEDKVGYRLHTTRRPRAHAGAAQEQTTSLILPAHAEARPIASFELECRRRRGQDALSVAEQGGGGAGRGGEGGEGWAINKLERAQRGCKRAETQIAKRQTKQREEQRGGRGKESGKGERERESESERESVGRACRCGSNGV